MAAREKLSRRTTGIITAAVLILLGAAVGYGINGLLSSRAPEEGLSEAQVGAIADKLIATRNDILVTPETDDGEEAPEEPSPSPAQSLIDGDASGGIALSQGAITSERQTYRQLREHREQLEGSGTVYTEADLTVEVDSLSVDEATATAVIDETTTFTGDQAGKHAEIEQDVERVMLLSRVEGNWIMNSMRTMSGKDAPENGL